MSTCSEIGTNRHERETPETGVHSVLISQDHQQQRVEGCSEGWLVPT